MQIALEKSSRGHFNLPEDYDPELLHFFMMSLPSNNRSTFLRPGKEIIIHARTVVVSYLVTAGLPDDEVWLIYIPAQKTIISPAKELTGAAASAKPEETASTPRGVLPLAEGREKVKETK